jgi:hypothetical protein
VNYRASESHRPGTLDRQTRPYIEKARILEEEAAVPMLTPYNLVVFIDGMLFILGMVTFISGLLLLALRASSSDVKSLAQQAARLGQKGITEDIAGLVGNASNLLDSMNQLVRTTRGVGIFLALLGLALMGASAWFAIQIYQASAVQP